MPRAKKRQLSPEALKLVAARFRVLSEPLRLRILQALEGGEMSVGAITEAVGSNQPNVSKHLKILQDAGLVGRRQEGNTVYCFIADETVFAICDAVCTSVEEHLNARAKAFS